MNIIWILKKELLQFYRNPKAVIQLTLFPVILIMILGFSLSGAFYNPEIYSRVNILYYVKDSGLLTDEFKRFMLQTEEKGIKFVAAKDVEEGYNSIKNKKYSCFVIIKNESSEVELYKNEDDTIKADIAKTLLSSFVQRYNIKYEINKESTEFTYQPRESEDRDYVKVVGTGVEKQPGSIDYYAVTMVILFVMYSSITGLKSIKSEHAGHTDIRLACSGVKKYEVLAGKLLGSFTYTMLQITLLILFSKYVLKAYWGNSIGFILILVASEILAMLSLGTGMAYMCKTETSTIVAYLNKLIPIMVFLGGGYLPIDSISNILNAISYISPIKWINKAIFQMIYSNAPGMAILILILNSIIALTFISITFILSKKEVA